jgi:hypothetical protein
MTGIDSGYNFDFRGIPTEITDRDVINNITDSDNWNEGHYIGPLTGLKKGNYHIDPLARIKIEFTGTALIRTAINVMQ